MAAEVEGAELDVAQRELFRGCRRDRQYLYSPPPHAFGGWGLTGVEGGDVRREVVVLEHVQERGLSGVIKAKEQDPRRLLVDAKKAQRSPEPIVQEHFNVLLPDYALADSLLTNLQLQALLNEDVCGAQSATSDNDNQRLALFLKRTQK